MEFKLHFRNWPAPDGPLACAAVPWDSQLLDLHAYELKITAPGRLAPDMPAAWLRELPRDKDCLVCAKIPTADVGLAHRLVRHGFYPVETLLDLQLPLTRFRPVERLRVRGLDLRPATAADLPALTEIARTAFATDRFHLDPHLTPERADRRYAWWLENAHEAGDWIFVLQDSQHERPAGFMHVRPGAAGHFDMGLAAVHPDFRNTMAGVRLYQDVLIECRRRGLKVATSRVSVNNLNPLKLAMRFGSIILGAAATLHWFQPAETSAAGTPAAQPGPRRPGAGRTKQA